MKPEDKQSNLANVFFTTELVIFQHAWIEISPGARLGYRVWGLSPGHGEREAITGVWGQSQRGPGSAP